jgi:dienelactone hydrolase
MPRPARKPRDFRAIARYDSAMRKRCVAAFIALICLSARHAAGVEVVSIPSLDGRLQLPGYWFKASGTGPRPAVITLHGCGGLLDRKGALPRNRHRVAEYFNVENMHALAVDSFTPRGEKSICETPDAQRRIQHEDRREDVFAAIRWLAQQPEVDTTRIAVVGNSNGGGTVLSVMDRTDRRVQAEPKQPRAAVAYYPPCRRYADMWNYEISAPLLLMIGESDDWTPPAHCVRLHAKVKRAQPDALFELVLYPDSHHGFDGYGPISVRPGLPTSSGTATVGGNPVARENSLRRMFDFLSAHMNWPLRLTHEERLRGHRFVTPPASGFAEAHDIAAVPLGEKGRTRYEHYLGLEVPKAFAISERGGWFISSSHSEAMRVSLEGCQRSGAKCWLYAVDAQVVWNEDPAVRIDSNRLRRRLP